MNQNPATKGDEFAVVTQVRNPWHRPVRSRSERATWQAGSLAQGPLESQHKETTMTTEKLCRWGILGAANIARKNWDSIRHAENATLVAVASRSKPRAEEYHPRMPACALRIRRRREACSYEELLARPRTSTRSTSRCRRRFARSGSSGPPRRASTCCAKSRVLRPRPNSKRCSPPAAKTTSSSWTA